MCIYPYDSLCIVIETLGKNKYHTTFFKRNDQAQYHNYKMSKLMNMQY